VNPKQFSEITIGIIGFGRVGSRLGTMAKCMGFRVVFADIKTIKDTHGCHQVEMAELLASSDVISIHVDGRAENNNLVSLEVLALMKHDVLFINTSRGFVVNPDELATHLSQNPNSYAILDVHDPEPFTANYPLLGLNNTSLFPHIAAKTETAMHNMGWVVRDVDKVLRGKEPMYQVCV
jgi:phosphoglycerate dehydrogenase-like enzyme